MALALLRVFIVSFILLNYASCDEPKCSKFSFEESLLEKMVRIEFEVEKFSKGLEEKYEEIDKIKTAAKEELQQLQHDRKMWNAEIERLKIDSIQTIKNQTGEHSCTYIINPLYTVGFFHTELRVGLAVYILKSPLRIYLWF